MEDYELVLGDCLEKMGDMPENHIDLTVTSPPYDNLRDYGEGFTGLNWKPIIKELYRVTKKVGVVVWVVSDQTKDSCESGTSFRQALWAMDCGFKNETMIWNKGGFTETQHNKYRYPHCFEYMFVWSKNSKPNSFTGIRDRNCKKSGTKTFSSKRDVDGIVKMNSNGRYKINSQSLRLNIWELPPENSNINRTSHPAQMSLQLARDHIYTWSNPNDLVFDPFLGSGTTGVAALRLNRRFVGIELDAGYMEIAKTRIGNVAGDYAVTEKEKATGQMGVI